jgi:hypothetical protein
MMASLRGRNMLQDNKKEHKKSAVLYIIYTVHFIVNQLTPTNAQ